MREEDVALILKKRYKTAGSYEAKCMVTNIADYFMNYYSQNNVSFDREKFWNEIFD